MARSMVATAATVLADDIRIKDLQLGKTSPRYTYLPEYKLKALQRLVTALKGITGRVDRFCLPPTMVGVFRTMTYNSSAGRVLVMQQTTCYSEMMRRETWRVRIRTRLSFPRASDPHQKLALTFEKALFVLFSRPRDVLHYRSLYTGLPWTFRSM
jgi:hypothetical protein